MIFETARVVEDARRPLRCRSWDFGVACLMLGVLPAVAAQERGPASKPPVRPAYPRTNLSTGYEVVPSWPAQPKNLTWGAMAGIAISPSGQVWTFNRGSVPVQVYTTEGEFVRSWGEGQFREPHQVHLTAKASSGWSIAAGTS